MSFYTGIDGTRYHSREDYEESLAPPAYGTRALAALYGPVSRFCLQTVAQKIDVWLKRLDERGEELQQPSPTAHRDMPKGVFISGIATGLRHMQRRRVKPVVAMAAGTGLVMGISSLLGAGLVVGAVAALVALPVSTGIGALGLLCVLGVPRAVAEGARALCNVPVGYSLRERFFKRLELEQDVAADREKRGLSPLCQALFDDERAAAKATPADRANWIYGLAKHFPEEFLEAAKKTERRDEAPESPSQAVRNPQTRPL